MARKSIEERVAFLEKDNKALRHELEREQAVTEIQNLMGRYAYRQIAEVETYDMFSKKSPDVRIEMPWGVFEGQKGIKKILFDFIQKGVLSGGRKKGIMVVVPLTTPCIEVARDGKTAKGLWIATGIRAECKTAGTAASGLGAWWIWSKYGIDFIKEDGGWKIWHFQLYGIIFSPYEKGWVRENKQANVAKALPDELKPDRPPTYSWMYSTTGLTENVPVPPEPYETWDGNSMTTSGDTRKKNV